MCQGPDQARSAALAGKSLDLPHVVCSSFMNLALLEARLIRLTCCGGHLGAPLLCAAAWCGPTRLNNSSSRPRLASTRIEAQLLHCHKYYHLFHFRFCLCCWPRGAQGRLGTAWVTLIKTPLRSRSGAYNTQNTCAKHNALDSRKTSGQTRRQSKSSLAVRMFCI